MESCIAASFRLLLEPCPAALSAHCNVIAVMDGQHAVKVRGTSNRLVGVVILFCAITLFSLHTVWAVVLPFLPDDSAMQTWLPARKWAIQLPSLILVTGLSSVGIYIGILLRSDALAATE